MVTQTFLFLDENSTATSNTLVVSNGRNLTLSVASTTSPVGAVSIAIYGKVDVNSDEVYVLGCINKDTLVTVSGTTGIAETGIYTLDVTGISQIYIQNNGTAGDVKVFGKLIG